MRQNFQAISIQFENCSGSDSVPCKLVLLLEPAGDLLVVFPHPFDIRLGLLNGALRRPLSRSKLIEFIPIKLLELLQLKVVVERRRARRNQASGGADAARLVEVVDVGPVATQPIPCEISADLVVGDPANYVPAVLLPDDSLDIGGQIQKFL